MHSAYTLSTDRIHFFKKIQDHADSVANKLSTDPILKPYTLQLKPVMFNTVSIHFQYKAITESLQSHVSFQAQFPADLLTATWPGFWSLHVFGLFVLCVPSAKKVHCLSSWKFIGIALGPSEVVDGLCLGLVHAQVKTVHQLASNVIRYNLNTYSF